MSEPRLFRLASSDELQLKAALASLRILSSGNVEQYFDNQKALLNNPEWRSKMAKQREINNGV